MASTIKVDNVQNQPGTNIVSKCGTDVTIGASGDTVALASGASQTGFGRTGTVDWVTTPKVTGDSPVTAATGSGYFLNTTAGTITINLPAGAAGSIVSMADYAGTWQTYAVTVAANGTEKIGGVDADVTLNTEGQSVTLVYVDSTQGWINTMDSTSNVRGSNFMVTTVSGACNTLATAPDCADTKIATFLGPGTFCVSNAAACAANNLVSYMVVAGGGGSGSPQGSGGGGAGGYREIKSPSATGYTASPLDGYPTPGNRITVSATGYPITVGGGGPGGVNGSDSIFSTITSSGGGYGGNGGTGYIGNPGGSGGGGGGRSAMAAGNGNDPATTPAQGFAGGTASPAPTPSCSDTGGGGGGATAVGTAGSPNGPGGNGGTGTTSCITATPTIRAGGGGGGSQIGAGGSAGPGGGGAGNSADGTVNTGGGAGGVALSPGGGRQGGSGIVVIRYKFQ